MAANVAASAADALGRAELPRVVLIGELGRLDADGRVGGREPMPETAASGHAGSHRKLAIGVREAVV